MPKEAWENLKKIFAVNTTAWKVQLNNVQQKDMSIISYTQVSRRTQSQTKKMCQYESMIVYLIFSSMEIVLVQFRYDYLICIFEQYYDYIPKNNYKTYTNPHLN